VKFFIIIYYYSPDSGNDRELVEEGPPPLGSCIKVCCILIQVFFLQMLDVLLKLSISKLSLHGVTCMLNQYWLLPAFELRVSHGSQIIKSLPYHDSCIINTTAAMMMLFSH